MYFLMRSQCITEDQIKKSVKMDWKIERSHKEDKDNNTVNMEFCACRNNTLCYFYLEIQVALRHRAYRTCP